MFWFLKRKSLLNIKCFDFEKKFIEHKMFWFLKKSLLNIKCVLIFSESFFCNIFHYKKNQARYYHKCVLFCMYSTVILVTFACGLNFLDRFSKSAQVSDFLKICPVGVGGRTDRRTDRHDEANSRFSQICQRA